MWDIQEKKTIGMVETGFKHAFVGFAEDGAGVVVFRGEEPRSRGIVPSSVS